MKGNNKNNTTNSVLGGLGVLKGDKGERFASRTPLSPLFKKTIIKDLLIALLFSSFALALLYLFEIFTRN